MPSSTRLLSLSMSACCMTRNLWSRRALHWILSRNLCPETQIKMDQILLLSGIIENNIKTFEYSNVCIMWYPITLQVVADNFPITHLRIWLPAGRYENRFCGAIDFLAKYDDTVLATRYSNYSVEISHYHIHPRWKSVLSGRIHTADRSLWRRLSRRHASHKSRQKGFHWYN